MAVTEPCVRNQLYSITLAKLLPAPNLKKIFNPATLKKMTAYIAQGDVLKHILLRVEGSRNYVVAGERRCIAVRQSCLISVPPFSSIAR